jgi:pyruvate kinase
MDRVKRVSGELNIPVALMLDTKGPEIRTGLVENDGVVAFSSGDPVIVSTDGALTSPTVNGKPGRISLSWTELTTKVKPGVKILIADGLLELEVVENNGTAVTCRAMNAAKIGSRKNVNLIGVHAGLPIMNEQDRLDIAFGAEQDIDFIAASFLSFPQELTEIREYLRSLKFHAKIIAKIESGEGLQNIEKIAQLSDGIMVARGDLAVQIPDERIPLAQKHIIETARRHGKPVITATQMLDSMIVNPRPTRAELTDVANAIFDGTDAVMLSGETANGAYPVEAVKTMARIAVTVEQSEEYRNHIRNSLPPLRGANIADTVSRSAYEIARTVNAKVIVTPTLSGTTAQLISKYRPEQPILAVTPELRALRAMLLDWGIYPHLTKNAENSDEMIQNAQKIAFDTGLAGISDRLVLAAGLPLQSPLPLNTVRVLIMGNVLARSGSGGFADPDISRANGKIVSATSATDARENLKMLGGEILVCPVLTLDYTPIIRIVSGVICEGPCKISDEVLSMINPCLVWLSSVHNASSKLESGLSVTLDGKALLVYEGTI